MCSSDLLQRILNYCRPSKVTIPSDTQRNPTWVPIEFYSFMLWNNSDPDQTVPIENLKTFWAEIELKISETTDLRVDFLKDKSEMTQADFRYRNVLLLIREVQLGYHSFRTHSICLSHNDQYIEQKYKIGQDIIIRLNTETEEVIDVKAIETQGSLSKEKWKWSVTFPNCQPVPIDEFQCLRSEQDPLNPNIQIIKLYGAYTHTLRETLNYNPQMWQMKYLMSHKRLNYVAGTRRWGKTIHAAYLIMRRLYCNPSTRRHAMRHVKALYVAPTEDKFKSVLDYIDAASERLKLLKVIKYHKDERRLQLVDEHVNHNGKRFVETVSTCDFTSGRSFEPARGNGSDEVIIDEAWFTPEDVYLNILPIIENEGATLFCISTIDWESQKQWFYEQLIHCEQFNDPEWFAMRITIDDIDDSIISASSKERMKKALEDKPVRYYAELYATFPEIEAVFSPSNLFIIRNDEMYRQKQFVSTIIGYDPAKRSDYAGIVVAQIHKDPKFWHELTVIETHKLQWDYTTTQKNFLLDLKKKYSCIEWQYESAYKLKTEIIIDATVVGDVVAESFGTMIDHKLWYTGNSLRAEVDPKSGIWKASKKTIVNNTSILIDNKRLHAWNNLEDLLKEVSSFKKYQSASGNMKYEAEIGHDDLVNAMMLCSFYFWFICWHIYEISDNASKDNRYVAEEIDRRTNLYKPYSSRMEPVKAKSKSYSFI